MLFSFLEGCQKAAPEPEDLPEAPVVEPKPMPEVIEPELVEEKESEPEPMSYKEFFSVERVFRKDNIEFKDEVRIVIEYSDPKRPLSSETKRTLTIYNDEELIYKGVTQGYMRNAYSIFVVEEDETNNMKRHVVRIDLSGKQQILFMEDNPKNSALYLFVCYNILFFCSNNKIYRYYIPDDYLELFYEIDLYESLFEGDFSSLIFYPISTTDILLGNGKKYHEFDVPPNTKSEASFFYSSLTEKCYNVYSFRETDDWACFFYFHLNHLGIDLRNEGISSFDDYKMKYIVPRGETAGSLEWYNLLIYTRDNQYLKKRTEDLIEMSIDPYDASTFRYPEDDVYFYDPEDMGWRRESGIVFAKESNWKIV